MLLNVLATELNSEVKGNDVEPEDLFNAVKRLHSRVEGSYASIA